MKKALSAVLAILFVVSVFVVPAMAREVFKSEIIPCGPRETTASCGSNPAAIDPLQRGEVEVLDSGAVRVELMGAAPDTTYRVFVGNWARGRDRDFRFEFRGDSDSYSIGTVMTDDSGNYNGAIETDNGDDFYFPPGTMIGQLNFAFNNPETGPTQFTSGLGYGSRRWSHEEHQQHQQQQQQQGSQPPWQNEYDRFKSILPK